MTLTQQQRDALRKRCSLILSGFKPMSPADEFRRLADWCDAHDVDHDHYGAGTAVTDFERKVATLLGKEAAVFVPSGVMAQSIAVRSWTEAVRLPRFGMHPTSHLAVHEEQAYAALMQLHGVVLGDRLRPLTAADLDATSQELACVVVELPIREAGGRLPTWDELDALKAAARTRGIRLHMDGARLWESAAFYDRSYADIADGFDSVYVSLYKGIGASSGAMLAGDAAFIANARLWRRRMGGTLYRMTPVVASAAMRFDERLAMMPALYRRALSFAADLDAMTGFRVDPAVPQTNVLHLYVDASADTVMDARDAVAEDTGVWLFGHVAAAQVPGWSVTEFYVGEVLLASDPTLVTGALRALCAKLGR